MTQMAAIITGSAGSIGRELCRAFKSAGYKVVGLDIKERSDVNADEWIQGDLVRLASDVVYRDELLALIRSISGAAGIHVLCNNAAEQRLGRTEEISMADWQVSLDVNLTAPFLLSQGLIKDLERACGSIVNVASIHARLTKPEFVAYSTTKCALVGLTRALAVDLGNRVRVNAICPAAIDTPMLREGFEGHGPAALEALQLCHPARRLGRPEEVAALALWLASPDASFVSGACYDIDGGIGARLHDPV